MPSIREEKPGDAAGIEIVHRDAFETAAEASLVNAIRASGMEQISLVAETPEEGIVGHILFTPVALSGNPEGVKIFGLAPLAVRSFRQGQGIGSALVQEGIEACRRSGVDALVVLGHPNYYPRFGFFPSVQAGVRSSYDVPDEVFMIVELRRGALKEAYGVITYAPEFEGM